MGAYVFDNCILVFVIIPFSEYNAPHIIPDMVLVIAVLPGLVVDTHFTGPLIVMSLVLRNVTPDVVVTLPLDTIPFCVTVITPLIVIPPVDVMLVSLEHTMLFVEISLLTTIVTPLV